MKENNKDIIDKLLSCFLEHETKQITIKSLFGGSGICFNNAMFAWIYNDNLYLRGHIDYLAMFTELNMTPLAFNAGVIVKLLQYYKVTSHLWQNEKKFNQFVQMVVKHSGLDKTSPHRIKEPRIKDLPNMTLSLERSLFRVGIVNVDSFRKQGSFKSYFKLEQYNRFLSKNILYSLHSALMGMHVATLTEEQKEALNKEYGQFTASL